MTNHRPTRIYDSSRERERLRLLGSDRTDFLHGQCTNDVQRLQPGQSCYAAFLNAKGKMRGEGHIICLPDAFLLETSRGVGPALEKFIITEDVTIEDVSERLGEWLVIGGQGGTTLRVVRGQDDAARWDSAPYQGPDGTSPADAITFSHPLGLGVIGDTPLPVTMSTEELEVLRVEVGVPLWGVDMDENTIPNEAGLEARAISYNKGCYIGQETIARIKTYGHVNKRLVQLAVDAEWVTQRGSVIYDGEREIGRVTSGVMSAKLGKPLVLGYVRREFAAVATKVTINQAPSWRAEVVGICGG